MELIIVFQLFVFYLVLAASPGNAQNTFLPPPDDGTAPAECYREAEAGTVFTLTGAYDPATLTPAACMEACAGLNDPDVDSAAVTGGNVCLCGKDASKFS